MLAYLVPPVNVSSPIPDMYVSAVLMDTTSWVAHKIEMYATLKLL